ncbi:MAG TPA: GAF domain-containing sensor histidine kinase [Ktedonobacterales bacterium]
MTADVTLANLSLDAATAFAQLRREHDRQQQRNEQLEEQVRALLVLQEIANTLSAELNLPPLLRRIAAAALRLTSAHASAVYLVDASRASLVVKAVENRNTAADSGSFGALSAGESHPGVVVEEDESNLPHITLNEGVAGWVAANGTLVMVADAATESRFTPTTLAVDNEHLGVHASSLVAVPMVFKGVVTGVLEVAQAEGGEGFDANSLDLMHTLASQAATAVANALLYRRLRAERDRIIQTQEDERKRLGRDLHDGPAQKLAQIAMSLEYAKQLAQHEPDRLIAELDSIRENALSTTREIRNLLFDLRPLVLDAENGGLVVAIKQFIDRFQTVPGPKMFLNAEYPERLSHNIEITVFAIVQEAVNNILKHGSAQTCWIDIQETPDRLMAVIRDDGDGFDVRQVQSEYENRGSWGLLSMMERAALIEAKLNIASQLGRGTAVSLDVPR